MTGREHQYPTFGRLDGPVVIVGFGSIGRGTLPLILRHFEIDPAEIVVIGPDVPTRACEPDVPLPALSMGCA